MVTTSAGTSPFPGSRELLPHQHTRFPSHPPLCNTCQMQVSSTAGISVGQWVRLWVQQPTQPAARRRSLLGQDGAAAAGGRRQLLQGRSGGGGAPAASQTYLPLSAAAAAARFSSASEALEAHGAEPGSGALPQRPVVASAGGTLDAHLYGENAADSGSSQLLQFIMAGAAAYLMMLESCRMVLHAALVGVQ